jgi:hypothetical protein
VAQEFLHKLRVDAPAEQERGEALASTSSALSAASGRLDGVPPENFEDEEDYWRAKRAIAQAGDLVVAEHGRRRERVAGGLSAE